jgi:hypothetical protein
MSGAERQFVLMVSPSDVVAQNRMMRVNAASLPGTDDAPRRAEARLYCYAQDPSQREAQHRHSTRTRTASQGAARASYSSPCLEGSSVR